MIDLAEIEKIVSVALSVAEAVLKYGPDVILGVENVVSDLKLAFKSATSGVPLTADQQAQYDQALADGEKVLAAAEAKADAEDAALATANPQDAA